MNLCTGVRNNPAQRVVEIIEDIQDIQLGVNENSENINVEFAKIKVMIDFIHDKHKQSDARLDQLESNEGKINLEDRKKFQEYLAFLILNINLLLKSTFDKRYPSSFINELTREKSDTEPILTDSQLEEMTRRLNNMKRNSEN